MSRAGDGYDYEEDYRNQAALWEQTTQNALNGRRGQQALRDLREALVHLPEKRLIARALCTVNPDARRPKANDSGWLAVDFNEIIEEQGQGVCAVGAYAWYQKVLSGMDPQAAFAALPTLPDTDSDIWETAYHGKEAGLVMSLAYHLAWKNDEDYGSLTPEQRYERFMRWLEKAIH